MKVLKRVIVPIYEFGELFLSKRGLEFITGLSEVFSECHSSVTVLYNLALL
jgi:hypothetical protein